jgi:ATP-dependent Lhr-like helicase
VPTPLVENSLAPFHPIVRDWFRDAFGEPTDIQEKAWKLISENEHALISAATGSGKTLAAFLWALNQLMVGEWELGLTRVVYISPLKALNNDIRRNLLEPLAALKERFRANGLEWPEIRVLTRSGDTEQNERRKMLRHPPEILITTPESLNLMLTSKDGQRALLGVKALILDEIHSVVGSKRGVYLMTAVERLAHLNGEFQRIALSATVRPMDTVGEFVGGLQQQGEGFRPRNVKQAKSSVKKEYAIEVRFPEGTDEDMPDDDFWRPIVLQIKEIVAASRSTLIFVNSRALCEKITFKINQGEPSPIAYSHHGSLSKEIRFAVEQRLKNGELKAIIATNSLEMGIDIGALDRVIMVQCPGVVSSAVQKVGRAGHQVGAVSQATLFPSHSRDFLEAAVLSQAIRDRDIEPIRPVENPLDVLAQVIVSMLGSGPWDIDELYRLMRSSYPYRNLQREPFELVLNMLAGRYEASRLRELKPRISINRSENTITARKGALLAYYFSGGVIPDRGYFHLRLEGPGSRIGELDEEFVWERSIGDVFTLGAQAWRIERITHNDVFVSPGQGSGPMPPFWRSEEFNRDFHYSARIGEFLRWADEEVEREGFTTTLESKLGFDKTTSKVLADLLRRQKLSTHSSLPHRFHILAELVDAAPGGAPGQQLILHTQWGGRVNRPFALALDAAWEERYGHRADIYVNNDCVVISASEEMPVDDVIRLVSISKVETLLRQRLEDSGFFGARFREAAGTALLITRQKAGQRLPLWLSRMRSKKLLDSVKKYSEFPIALEAWRACLKDEFDMESLRIVLSELEQGSTDVSYIRTSVASPFASSVAWRQINERYMYDTDDPRGGGASSLREDLIQSVTFDDSLRPTVGRAVIDEFERKRQRLASGYAPTDEIELKEWLRDRIALPEAEWELLAKAVGSLVPSDIDFDEYVAVSLPIVRSGGYIYLEEDEDRVKALLGATPDPDLFSEWLSYYGPVSVISLRSRFSLPEIELDALMDALVDDRRLVVGKLVEDSNEIFACDYDNFETLLRIQRARSRPSFDPLPIVSLPRFIAQSSGILGPDKEDKGVAKCLERLTGFSERAALWEEEILPSRVPGYRSMMLDACLAESDIEWSGTDEARICFGFTEERVLNWAYQDCELSESERKVFEFMKSREGGRFSFEELRNNLELNSEELEETLWSIVWKGKASNDSFVAVRRGLLADFSIAKAARKQNRRRGSFAPSRASMGRRTRMLSAAKTILYPGSWYAIPNPSDEVDAIESLERDKERVRILLDRYGLLFRELLAKEPTGYRWRDVFKALRVMELSGEILSGVFFKSIPGLQFASHEAFRRLKKAWKGRPVYWLNASDPASLCGTGLEAFKESLPKRLSSTRLGYRGDELILEVHRKGKVLVFHVDPDDPDLERVLDPIRDLLTRSFNPVQSIPLETINGEDARNSPFLDALDANFRLYRDHRRVVIEGVK